jgi:hypothetical protein
MLVVDLLHEWNIGGGLAIIVHLFRILGALKKQDSSRFSGLLKDVDKRYDAIPMPEGES